MKVFGTLTILLKGMAMGAADVVPGVSGGTIAFITGIYERLLNAIKSINLSLLGTLRSKGIAAAWKQADAGFLLPLLAGIAISLVSLARLLTFLLENHPIPIWSFFFGLVLASVWVVQKQRKTKHWNQIPALLVGAGLAFWITMAVPAETPEALWFVFLSGAIAICAMILPGISGSFILLILGKYAFIMQAFKNLDLLTLAVFALGCLTGLLSFVRLVSFFFKKYHDFTVVLLTGFMLGSLPKLWPWRIPTLVVETAKGPKIIQESAVLPKEYALHTQQNPELMLAVLGLAVGVLLVVLLDFAPKPKTRE